MTPLKQRRAVARSVSEELAERGDVDAVLLIGSTATGYADENSDVDLTVVGPEQGDERSVDGIHVEWTTLDRDDLDAKLDGWEDDTDRYMYANAEVLYDRAGVAELLDDHSEYPPEVRTEKLYAGWFYATGNTFDAQKAVERGDERVAQCATAAAVEQFVALTYVLENRFPPYRKWLFRAPPLSLPGIDAALSGDVSALETVQTELEPRLTSELDTERVEKPYLFQPSFDPLG
ncbi:DUF4037 domain-containing protein [Halovenus salina]|uniref:DUF4037 domain-containing protein n=1 Tax=Halovenus salina TaxID=1510225 RepID=A0ABD5W0Q9_9EURY|nr:DUF4037 domain-containing protein [Halovenus salina]